MIGIRGRNGIGATGSPRENDKDFSQIVRVRGRQPRRQEKTLRVGGGLGAGSESLEERINDEPGTSYSGCARGDLF